MANDAEQTNGLAEPTARTVVLAAIDASPSADAVIEAAARQAKMMRAELHLVHVNDETPLATPALGGAVISSPSEMCSAEAGVLESRVAAARRRFELLVRGHLLTGVAWRSVVQLAVDLDAELIVVGTHDYQGFERLVLGSVAEMIMRNARCPVLVVRSKAPHDDAGVPEVEPPCPDCCPCQPA